MSTTETPVPRTDGQLNARLAEFLANNPHSRLEVTEGGPIIKDPWGDDTLILRLPGNPDNAITTLNAVILPPLFSAVYHMSTRDIEFIYTPLRADVHGRKFQFNFRGKVIHCEFGDISDRVDAIADMAAPVGPPSHTDHRNMGIFNIIRASRATANERMGTSFWIHAIDWDDEYVLELARNLNFYMWYFDRESPKVRIHERSKFELPGNIPRFLFDTFPSVISGRPLDMFVLQLWESFVSGNAVHRVLYGYQIIEYVAFYYLQESISQTIRRVLLSPETLERSREATRQILEVMADDKMEDAAKIERVVETYVDHEQLAAALTRNLRYFSEDIRFDGGFVLPALCSAKWEPKDKKECKDMSRRVANSLRKVRNAIAHSRESRNTNSIAPTRANQDRIYPLLDPLSVVVSNLLLYREVDG